MIRFLSPALGLVLMFGLGCVVPMAARAADTVRVQSTGTELGTTPILIDAPAGLSMGPYSLQNGSGEKIPALVFELEGQRRLGAVLPAVPASETITYALTPGGTGTGAALAKGASRPDVAIQVDGKPFATVVFSGPSKPYVYPLFGPTGEMFTRSYPMKEVEGEAKDHPHQRSFWLTHGSVNGHDFWASDPINGEKPQFGTIEARDVEVVGSETPSALVAIRHASDWLGPDGKPVCTDVRTLTFYGAESPRIVDVDVTIRATHGPVTFGDTKEGMFGLRVASSMDVKRKEGGKITNAEGIHDLEAWGKRSPWVDYTGPVGGKTVGIAIFNQPGSFRYPTAWHVRDYGLFAANPFGYHDFKIAEKGEHTIPSGESIRFGYRVVLHEGDTKSARVGEAFAAFAHPPRVEISTDR